MSPRILLILPSTTYRAAAFVEAARRIGAELTVASDHRSTFAAAQPDGLLYLDCDRPDAVLAGVMGFTAYHPVHAVFGVDDATAVAAACAAQALGLRQHSPAAAEAARDKYAQRTILRAAGVPVPAFALHRFADDLARAASVTSYPAVLKPTHLAMSRGVIRADDPASFVRAAERIRAILERGDSPGAGRAAFLAEAFVPGDEFALEGAMLDGALRVLALFDKPDPLDGPYFEETIYAAPSRLPAEAQAQVARTVEQAARALGLTHGPVHAEVRWNERGPWIIEVAARPIGGRCSAVLQFGDGVSLEEVLLRGALAGWRAGCLDAFPREASAAAVMMVPVPRRGTLVRVDGTADARRVPWIDDVVVTAHPGQALEPLPEGSVYLGFIYAKAEDAGTAVAAIRQAHGKLRISLE